ncbi:hypothetical protein VN97_g9792 [Penicillium thymicola]|uniref:Uncharacterized protein n=1 Tax=Penicillium thymicola TaxID=293382 RepID=A0AAI9TAV1_PENTH|nr:hypothetical protein VN97_g9792 [Penicillium thymicola]
MSYGNGRASQGVCPIRVDFSLYRAEYEQKQKDHDKSGIRTHASCETRKLLLVMESRYTLTWRLRPTRPSYHKINYSGPNWLTI